MDRAPRGRIWFEYTLEDWNLYDFSPPWNHATQGTHDEKLAKLSDPAIRQAMKDDYPNFMTVGTGGALDCITVKEAEGNLAGYVGRTVAEMISDPYVMAGVSDGGAHTKFFSAGSYTTDLLIWLVREAQTLSLEEAHYHLSYLPAQAAGFLDRGYLHAGAPGRQRTSWCTTSRS